MDWRKSIGLDDIKLGLMTAGRESRLTLSVKFHG